MYIDLISTFFHRYIPYPRNPGETWLELVEDNTELSLTDIIYNIYSLCDHQDNMIKICVHFRRVIEEPIIDLMQYYKHQLKASTSIRKKQGAKVLLSDFTIDQFNSLYLNFKDNKFEEFMGD